jgi:hypothetical protein
MIDESALEFSGAFYIKKAPRNNKELIVIN